MSLTRKHFVAIAELLGEAKMTGLFADGNSHYQFTKELANQLAGTNSRFDRERFMNAARAEYTPDDVPTVDELMEAMGLTEEDYAERLPERDCD